MKHLGQSGTGTDKQEEAHMHMVVPSEKMLDKGYHTYS